MDCHLDLKKHGDRIWIKGQTEGEGLKMSLVKKEGSKVRNVVGIGENS